MRQIPRSTERISSIKYVVYVEFVACCYQCLTVWCGQCLIHHVFLSFIDVYLRCPFITSVIVTMKYRQQLTLTLCRRWTCSRLRGRLVVLAASMNERDRQQSDRHAAMAPTVMAWSCMNMTCLSVKLITNPWRLLEFRNLFGTRPFSHHMRIRRVRVRVGLELRLGLGLGWLWCENGLLTEEAWLMSLLWYRCDLARLTYLVVCRPSISYVS